MIPSPPSSKPGSTSATWTEGSRELHEPRGMLTGSLNRAASTRALARHFRARDLPRSATRKTSPHASCPGEAPAAASRSGSHFAFVCGTGGC
jgi:hypothetical protein